jgi:hypothetical protein
MVESGGSRLPYFGAGRNAELSRVTGAFEEGRRMKRLLILLLGAVLAVGLIVQASGASSRDQKVLDFDTLVGVSGPFVGTANPIRGVNGGGLPWQIAEAKGELASNGSLEVKVKGLVLLNGTNPIGSFRAIVSCLTIVNGSPATTNVATDPFPATGTGDAKIEATVELPSPCFAPIIFVGPSPTTWFAVTGTS